MLCPVMLKLLAVMRRLQIPDEDMITIPAKVYSQSQNLYFEYIAPYMLLTENGKTSMEVTIYYRDEDGVPYGQRCRINEKSGKGERSSMFRCGGNDERTNFSAIVKRMLEFIVN